jgi:LmbE family N-acetylglucosaminyl deacetylase
MILNKKKILMVLAHCDDEIICGWPIFQNFNINKKIIIASSDFKNPNRIWCSNRKFIFREVCRQYKIESFCLDYDSEFSTCQNDLTEISIELIQCINKVDFDFIFTHNPYGEYANPDHVFLFNLIKNNFSEKIIISDIFYKNIYPHYGKDPNVSENLFHSNYYKYKISEEILNENIYNDVKSYYKDFNIWTWIDDAVVNKSSLYKI